MVDNNGATGQVTSNYTYDADGNLLSSSDDNARTIAYTYDVAAEATCITYPVIASPNCANAPSSTNSVVDRTYDGDGRMATTKDWFGHTITYSNYNQNSQLEDQLPTTPSPSPTLRPDGNLTSANYAGPLREQTRGPTTPTSRRPPRTSWAPSLRRPTRTTATSR